MIAYLKGEIQSLEATYLIIDVAGVGYHVNIPLSAFDALKDKKRLQC